jgi:hypothetical protein
MNMYADNASENNNKSVANNSPQDNTAQQQAKSEDKDQQAGAYQQMASNSPQVQQLKAIQEMANDSSQVKQLKDYQSMANSYTAETTQLKANNTGLPDQLKSGVESLSGMSMDHVKVHYNSDKPSQLQAHAYAQGSEIHVAPGQEKHVPHEAWHVVQQAQGRVKPTMQMKAGVPVNDDAGLENEADVMGAKALQTQGDATQLQAMAVPAAAPAQLVKDEAKRPVLDKRMDDLRGEAIGILSKMKVLGEDWEKTYGKKGKKKGENIFEKTDHKAEIRKAALKEIWSNLSTEEKLELAGLGMKVTGKAVAGIGRGIKEGIGLLPESGGKKKEKEPEPEQEKEQDKGSGWISELSQEHLEAVYEAYSHLNRALDKIAEGKEKISKEAGKIGQALGEEVGKLRNEADFNKRMEALKQDFLTAKKRYQLLNEEVTANADSERYQDELDALSFAMVSLNGPNMVYALGGLTGEARKKHPVICEDAIVAIQLSKPVLRDGVGGLLGSAFSFIGGLVESERSKALKLTTAQDELAVELGVVINKSWGAYTKWGWTPTAVKSIRSALPKQATSVLKIGEAKKLSAATNKEKSDNRFAETQIFYDAMANVDVTNLQSLQVTKSIIAQIGTKLA